MAYTDQDDPFLQVQADVQSTLQQTRPLFSSYLRIRTLATSATSPELLQSRSELLSTLSTLSADLADLIDAVNAVEHDPYRFGLDVVEVGRRREFVRDVGGEVESMRRELEDVVEHRGDGAVGAVGLANGSVGRGRSGNELPDPNSFAVSGGGGDDDGGAEDAYGEFEHQQQIEMMHEQDEQLDGVFRTVGNLRIQAEDMGRELEEQDVLLDEVDTLADRVGGKLQIGVKKVGHIIKKNEDTVSSCCIAVLIFVLILLLILVIVL
ncbi:hypothetical protein EPUS_03872 [Endocarpon pusillum Z07020]|uniref:t-SNARE affecting a late Golgi compartment protein 1 n=1 Tax=Endocarpon pusillum (strain Z07020 / HMAS-L-300199) TaxID=1263415 RepID=U1G996_ENDPU|nr:uncharacterized protein EPUS_03872 [Endocarpon pusillum Z07020]ERF74057.1 hypothetical protein EPUS_03872 [Endocarpon pusillum Z07020]